MFVGRGGKRFPPLPAKQSALGGGRAGQYAQFAGTGQRVSPVHLAEKLCYGEQ